MDPAVPPGTRLPDGPPSTRENGLKWLFQPYYFLRECGQKYGDVFTLELGGYGSFVLFSHPDAIRTIFTSDPAVCHAGAGNAVLRPFLGNGSLLLLEGPRHLAERRLLLPAFHAATIAEYGPLIRDAALGAINAWQTGQLVRMQDVMQDISLEVVMRAVFGLPSESSAELKLKLHGFLNDSKFNLALIGLLDEDLDGRAAWREFRETLQRIHALVDAQVAQRRAGDAATSHGILGLLTEARREDGSALSDDELRDELVTLVVTGYETTATALAWAMYWIHRENAIHARLLEELSGGDVDVAVKSEYLDALCKEVLRIHPVIPIVARQLQSPVSIAGHQIPAGVTVAPCIYLTHHREELYPDPDRFRPERFLERNYSPYEYLPFGGGARRCIGMPLAMREMKVVLATLLPRCRLELVDATDVRPQRRSVTVAPSGGPLMRVLSAPH